MDDRTPVVFVHDVGRDHSVWAPVTAQLDRPTITYDLIGHGSTPPQVRPLHIDDFVRQLHRQIVESGQPSAVVVGHGLGGLIGLRLAHSRPETVARLVTVATPYKRSDGQRQQELELLTDLTDAPEDDRPAVDIGAACDEATFLKTHRIFATVDAELADDLGPVSMPALVVTGERDRSTPPAMAQALASDLPGAGPAVIVSGADRSSVVDHPGDLLTAVVDFLAS